MRSGRPLLGITGSLVQLNSALCLTASLKYLLRVMATGELSESENVKDDKPDTDRHREIQIDTERHR